MENRFHDRDPVRRPERILLIAYHVSPYKGSEPGVGWGRACQTARYFRTWVICHAFYSQNEIAKYVSESGPIEGLNFIFLPGTPIENLFLKTPLRFYVSYYLWFRRAYKLAAELHSREPIDILHQVNWATYREPGHAWKVDVPFVWGPIGGMENLPWSFLPSLGFAGAIREGLRNVANSILFRFSPRVIRTAKRASAVLVSYSHGKKLFKRVHGIDSTVLTNTCIASVYTSQKEERGTDQSLRILWSGRFLNRKALPLLIHALKDMPRDFRYELRILGDGPQKNRWIRLCSKAGIAENCIWLGWLPRDKAIAQLQWADVFVFTSLRDQLGTVILEAMCHGVPVICMDHSATSDIVNESCGIKLAVSSPAQFQEELRRALISLSADPERLQRLSKGARKRAQLYTWTSNGARMAEVYKRVLRDSGERARTAERECGQRI